MSIPQVWVCVECEFENPITDLNSLLACDTCGTDNENKDSLVALVNARDAAQAAAEAEAAMRREEAAAQAAAEHAELERKMQALQIEKDRTFFADRVGNASGKL